MKKVRGIPKAQPRARAFKNKAGQVRTYTPGTAEDWKNRIAAEFEDVAGTNIEDPVEIAITYFLPRPKKYKRKKDPVHGFPHVIKPDIDNLNKSVLDCLTQIGVLSDDKIVWSIRVQKLYADKKESFVGAIISIDY